MAFTDHHVLSASDISWRLCSRSPWISQLVEELPSIAGQTGTACHTIAELCLRSGVDASEYIGDSINGIAITEELAGNIQVYLDHARELIDTVPSEYVYIEVKVDLSGYIPDGFGTCDLATFNPATGRLTVADYKSGRYLREPDEQLEAYALGLYDVIRTRPELHVTDIDLQVIQPADTPPVKTRLLTPLELEYRGEVLKEQAAAAIAPTGAYNPGARQCKYCTGRVICPALSKQALTLAGVSNPEHNLPGAYKNIDSLSDSELQSVYPHLEHVSAWCDAAKAHIETRVRQGTIEVPGYKLVAGRKGHRKWTDEKEVIRFLKNRRIKDSDLFDTKLKTPAQIDKLSRLTKKARHELQSLVYQTEGAPRVVKEQSKLPEITPGETAQTKPKQKLKLKRKGK